jgi:hypothetical protein
MLLAISFYHRRGGFKSLNVLAPMHRGLNFACSIGKSDCWVKESVCEEKAVRELTT